MRSDWEVGDLSLARWDWAFHSEKLRQSKYDLAESQLKPCFGMINVLENGFFCAVTQVWSKP